MFTKDGNWIDPQGTQFTNPVFQVASADFNSNTSSSHRLDITGGIAGAAPVSSDHSSQHLRYRVYYWADQASRDANNMPYVLANNNPIGEWFDAPLDDTYDIATMTPEQMAEKHLQEVVLVA